MALEPQGLAYIKTCQLGAQFDRLLSRVDKQRVHVIFLEDLSADPRLEWLRLQRFIGVDDDGRTEFTASNVRITVRWVAANRALAQLIKLKHRIGFCRGLGIGNMLRERVFSRPATRSERALQHQMRMRLQNLLREDARLLGELTGRSFDYVDHP